MSNTDHDYGFQLHYFCSVMLVGQVHFVASSICSACYLFILIRLKFSEVTHDGIQGKEIGAS